MGKELPIVSRKRKETDEAKNGEQFERFVEAAEKTGQFDESVLDEAIKKIVKVKPKKGAQKKTEK